MLVHTYAEYSAMLAHSLNVLHLIRQFERYEFQSDQRSLNRGFLQGTLWFSNGTELHWREFVDTGLARVRLMYAYHAQDTDKNCMFRYDNAPHRPALGFADHKHLVDGSIVEVIEPPTLEEVIREIISTLL